MNSLIDRVQIAIIAAAHLHDDMLVERSGIPLVETAPAQPRPVAARKSWDKGKPPMNGARQMARYGRQAARGQLNRAGGLV